MVPNDEFEYENIFSIFFSVSFTRIEVVMAKGNSTQ